MSEAELRKACAMGDLEAVQTMIKRGTSVNGKDERDGWTPLHHAAYGGHVDILGDLIKARGNVNVQSTNGSTPLMWASEAEDARAVKMLLDAKANPDHVNVYGNTALHFAAPAGRHEACELLMKAGAKNTFANNCNKTALQVSIDYDRPKCAHFIDPEYRWA